MPKIKLSRKLVDDSGFKKDHYGFDCPGCWSYHQIPVEGGAAWQWNGSIESPTFKPSILVRWTKPMTDEQYNRAMAGEDVSSELKHIICHSFVTDGKIQFLSDCTHKLVGQTVELPNLGVKE